MVLYQKNVEFCKLKPANFSTTVATCQDPQAEALVVDLDDEPIAVDDDHKDKVCIPRSFG